MHPYEVDRLADEHRRRLLTLIFQPGSRTEG